MQRNERPIIFHARPSLTQSEQKTQGENPGTKSYLDPQCVSDMRPQLGPAVAPATRDRYALPHDFHPRPRCPPALPSAECCDLHGRVREQEMGGKECVC